MRCRPSPPYEPDVDVPGADRRSALILALRAPGGGSAESARAGDFVDLLAADGWSVTYVTAKPLADSREASELRQRGIPVHDGAGELERLLLTGTYAVALCASWQIAELYLATIRRLSPETAVAVDAPSLQFVRDARRGHDRPGESHALGYLAGEYGSETTGELNAYASVDVVLTGTASDATLLNTVLGDDELARWVPDAEEEPTGKRAAGSRSGIVFPAPAADPAYADAAEFLRAEIAPRIDAELLGRHPLLVASGLEAAPRIRPLVEHAWLTLLPLREEPVSRRPLIQSLLAGTPAVASEAAARDLGVHGEAGVLVATEPSSFAAAVARLAADDELWRRLARRGRTRLKGSHARSVVAERLREALAVAEERKRGRPPPVSGSRERFELRLRRQRNRGLVPAIREVVRAFVAADARVLVVSDGSDELLRLDAVNPTPFPRAADETEAGARPRDSDEAIALLEGEIRAGAESLVIPSTASGWLASYPGFTDYLRARFALREEEACTLVDLRGGGGTASSPARAGVRAVAFYLPQFHPIPENDAWWGAGFTEWSNVARARPLFSGHQQPRVPADLGFYDLRLAETREEQARLAQEAGIEAFCYYHYWFHGRRLLETPFDAVLASGRPDFPFCLCWANEPWSRRWDGSEEDVLQPQSYSPEDDLAHVRWLLPALADPRALTVDGKPVFLVYHARSVPDSARTADLWREEVRKAGLRGLHLVSVETDRDTGWNATLAGFDATVRFQPQFSRLLALPAQAHDGPEGLRVWDYEQTWKELARGDAPGYTRYESVFPAWDNTPRRGERGWVVHDSTPESYGRWLEQAAAEAMSRPPEHRLLFLNAWNEWAEGAYLEPDLKNGRAYLDATAAALRGVIPAPREESGDPAQVPRLREARAGEPQEAETERPLGTEPRARAIAFYLPQFHPTPENDEWWGRGFTEWTNVVQAQPLFPGHYQPHLPSHLGFYDLRVPEVREVQAELAREHGIEAFCYWHYWFSGKRLLHKPFDDTLASGRPDFPFCLAWANESWSRRWLGEPRDVLIEQQYSEKDDVEHARWLTAAFADPRYLRVLGRPLFVVYRPKWLENPQRTAEILRRECVTAGVPEPFLLGTTSWAGIDCRDLGFDGTIEFEPRLTALSDPTGETLNLHDYAEARAEMKTVRDFPVYPSIVVAWDNTPRRGRMGTVFTDSTPEAFERGLGELVESVQDRPFPDRLVFLNAWNEWAEGNHLEPDEKHGLGYLEAVRNVIFERMPGRAPVAGLVAARRT